MRRISKGQKTKKLETNNIDDEEVSSVEANIDVKTPSPVKKRSSRGQGKVIDEDDKIEKEKQENGKAIKKRKKDTNESIEDESDAASEKPASKKKKEQDKDYDSNESDLESGKPLSKKKEGKEIKDAEIKEKEVEQNGKVATKVGKNKKKSKVAEKEEESDNEQEYEVEKIVDQRTIKGRRQFLVRWKGYTEESDTWEHEKELNCERLIEEFLEEQENESKDKKVPEKKGKQAGKKTKDRSSKKESRSSNGTPKDSKDESGDETDDSTEYEVEKIIEVHFKKDKTREFLIRWKGFSSKSDTWEPEEHLNCPELINKFMEKLEKIKNLDSRELRENPAHTNRYTLTMHADKRQSRRNANKQRKTYFEN